MKIDYGDVEVIDHVTHPEYWSLLVECKKLKISVWYDVSVEGSDVTGEWNQYIFHKDDPEDMKIQKFQDDDNVLEIVDSVTLEFLENHNFVGQDENGNWFKI